MNAVDDGNLTPMLKQYFEIKNKYSDCILFFRLGDFYEMFNEDAQTASRILGLTLTRKPAGKNKSIPLAGIPYHAYENYLNKLVKNGYKVAICEQLEDPSNKANKIVERGVIRIITPGTILSENILQGKEFNYLCAFDIAADKKENITGICFLELSTGKFQLTEFSDNSKYEKLETELIKFKPAEFVIPESLTDKHPKLKEILAQFENTRINYFEDWKFDYNTGLKTLTDLLKTASLDGFGCQNRFRAVACAGSLIKYIEETQMVEPTHIHTLTFYNIEDYLIIDGDTRRNLELITTMRDNSSEYTLFWAVDNTVLNAGGRLLKDWILNPLIDIDEIKKRQDGISELFNNQILRAELRELLKNIYDIERILSKISCKTVNPRDLISLKLSLEQLPFIKNKISVCSSNLLNSIYIDFDECSDIFELINISIADNPPMILSDGGIIKKGYNAEVDELRKIRFEGKDFIVALEDNERKRTGIQSLKIKYNKVFGYYIEITNANLDKTPENYIRKQTLVNAERFITPELKDYETKVLTAEDKLVTLEETLFTDIREKINEHIPRLQKTAHYIALIDVISALAETAKRSNYICPEVNSGSAITIKNSRHPVIEKLSATEKFVDNDIVIDCENSMVQIITGPNMAGKSTYIRQAALIVLLAQIGSFVPAKEATVGAVDRIFTRVGAADNLVRGQSTFMVEMIEAANILNNSTNRSLIILDEIGRGTSTFDGLSLAWAIAEHISLNIKAKTLFATHYHELIELASILSNVKNYNVAVKEWGDKIIFLRKIIEGGASRSYGIQVARLAGLPDAVISRAREILVTLETQRAMNPVDDMPLFTMQALAEEKSVRHSADTETVSNALIEKQNSIIKKINEFDLNSSSPINCMNFLENLKSEIDLLKCCF